MPKPPCPLCWLLDKLDFPEGEPRLLMHLYTIVALLGMLFLVSAALYV